VATRFFCVSNTATYAPTTGKKSTALPNGTNRTVTTNESRAFSLTNNASATNASNTTAAQTARQSGMTLRCTSERLSAQTISANTWSIRYRLTQGNATSNQYLALSIYVWRPSNNSVVGYIYDNSAQLGAEAPGAYATTTVSGASVTAQAGDVLVTEFWFTCAQGMATSYSSVFEYNTIDSWVETPQDLLFFAEQFTQFFIID
jgi:hypothetical protein